MEKNRKKEYVCVYVCVCIMLNQFALHLKLTQYCKSTILQFLKVAYFFKNLRELRQILWL